MISDKVHIGDSRSAPCSQIWLSLSISNSRKCDIWKMAFQCRLSRDVWSGSSVGMHAKSLSPVGRCPGIHVPANLPGGNHSLAPHFTPVCSCTQARSTYSLVRRPRLQCEVCSGLVCGRRVDRVSHAEGSKHFELPRPLHCACSGRFVAFPEIAVDGLRSGRHQGEQRAGNSPSLVSVCPGRRTN